MKDSDYLYEIEDYKLFSPKINLDALKNSSVFLTGGTGFLGKSLLDLFYFFNEEQRSNITIYILTRNEESFTREFPKFANHRNFVFLEGDIKSFVYPSVEFDYIIHAATEADDSKIIHQPSEMFWNISKGTNHILEFCKLKNPKKFLFLSSGAVYGRQPPELEKVSESYAGGPFLNDRKASYAEGKRVGEFLCKFYEKEHGLNFSIARCFAFIGPFLPLSGAYAAGNFIYDVLKGQDIEIRGDGTDIRSYLYTFDLSFWLITILLEKESGKIYNVGSDESISILGIAEKIKFLSGAKSKITVKGVKDPMKLPDRYVPSIDFAKQNLGLNIFTSLDETILQTLKFFEKSFT